ncbi:MAG: hypothetical protein ACLTE2_02855 [Eubacteriales bacterium]
MYKKAAVEGRKEVVDFVNNILTPVNAQRGDALPVSAFVGMEDGTMPQGTAAYEKRGIAVDVPEWMPENCIQYVTSVHIAYALTSVIRPITNDRGLMAKQRRSNQIYEYRAEYA